MGKLDQPGYPLPAGELGDDDIVCQLVFLPDRPEYWQAFIAAYHYMTTWRAWERDADKRGKDAAANWRAAFELTMECWRMACLDELQNNVAAILSLLQNQDPCCSENITYYDSTTYITIIVPGVGDDPEYYGETAVSDWDEWKEYLCHNANLWVDELVRAASTIEVALDTGGLTIGLLAAIMTAIAFFVVGGVLALPIVMVILFGIATGVSATIYADAAVDIEDARDDIVCAVVNGGDVAALIESVLSSGIAWDTLFSFIDYDSAMAILYEGGDGVTFLEAEKRFDCVCGTTEGYTLVIAPGGMGTVEDQNHISPVYSAGCWRTTVVRVEDEIPEFVAWRIKNITVLNEEGTCGTNIYRVWTHDGGSLFYYGDYPPTNLDRCSLLTITTNYDFGTIEINWDVVT